jgi:hypothetical protein
MYERLLKETERYLEHRKEIVVPVKQVWDAMIKQGRSSSFTVPTLMADFECLLEGDRRFEFVIEKNAAGAMSAVGNNFFEHEEMEKLGFSDDQRVKLRRIPLPTAEDEEGDPSDSAISLEDLDKELADTSLLDGGSAPATRSTSKSIANISRTEKGKSSSKTPRSQKKKVAAGGAKKMMAKRSSPKKRKK